MAHISEDELEAYVMRALPEAVSAGVEEHLLVCAACRQRLDETEQYVKAMRGAAIEVNKRTGGC